MSNAIGVLRATMDDPLIDLLRRHTLKLLTDPQRRNLFADDGIKLSSTSNNSWMSKSALFQHVARKVLRLHVIDPRVASVLMAWESSR